MRWYITLNGEECSDPAPVEAVLYSSNAQTVNVHKGATIAGMYQIAHSKQCKQLPYVLAMTVHVQYHDNLEAAAYHNINIMLNPQDYHV